MDHITKPSCNCHYLAYLAVPIRRGPGHSLHTEALHHHRLDTTKQELGWKRYTGLYLFFSLIENVDRGFYSDLQALATFLHIQDFFKYLIFIFYHFIFFKSYFFFLTNLLKLLQTHENFVTIWGEGVFLLECLVQFNMKRYSWLSISVLKHHTLEESKPRCMQTLKLQLWFKH